MRLLTSSSTNRWKAAEIQLHSSTLARVLTHLKCLVLREWSYSQELCSLGQDAVDSSMCCPLLSLHLFFSPHLPFHPISPGLQPGLRFWVAQVELDSFPGIWRCPSPELLQGRKLQTQLALVPSLGWWGQGGEAGGAWELEDSYGETADASDKSLLGTLFCFMVFRKCCAVRFLWIIDSGPAAVCCKAIFCCSWTLYFKCPQDKSKLWGLISTGYGPLVTILLSGASFELKGQSTASGVRLPTEDCPCLDHVPTRRVHQWDHHVCFSCRIIIT